MKILDNKLFNMKKGVAEFSDQCRLFYPNYNEEYKNKLLNFLKTESKEFPIRTYPGIFWAIPSELRNSPYVLIKID